MKEGQPTSIETVTGGASRDWGPLPHAKETSLKEAVESRRSSLDPPSDGDEDFFPEEQNWETEGSGIADEAEKLIDQLHLCLGSIKTGNNSIKLKKQVFSLLDSLVELGTIDKKQKKKLFVIIYSNDELSIFYLTQASQNYKGAENGMFHTILQ